jgi:hypothetical protein
LKSTIDLRICFAPEYLGETNSIEDAIALMKNLDKLLNDYSQNLLADCGNSLVVGLCSGWYKFLEIKVDDSQINTQTVKVPLNKSIRGVIQSCSSEPLL